jgi:hypothetical protein
MITHKGLTYSPRIAAKICIQHMFVNADWENIINTCFPELTDIEKIGVVHRMERLFERITANDLRITAKEHNFKRYTSEEQKRDMKRRAMKTMAQKTHKRNTVLKQEYIKEVKLEQDIKERNNIKKNELNHIVKKKIKSDPFVPDPAFAVDPKEESEEMF